MTFYLLESIGRGSYIEVHWQAESEGIGFGVQGFLPFEGDALPSLILDNAAFSRLVDSEAKLAALVGTGIAIFRYDPGVGGSTDILLHMLAVGDDRQLARLDSKRLLVGCLAEIAETSD